MPLVSTEIISGLQAERANAAAIVAACDAALAVFAPFEPVPAIRHAYHGKPTQNPRREPKPAKQKAARVAPVETPAASASKVGRYAEVIVKALRHHSLAPHHSADRVVLNREIAKACDVKLEQLLSGDVSNALSKLKAAGTIERTGTVWALVEKP